MQSKNLIYSINFTFDCLLNFNKTKQNKTITKLTYLKNFTNLTNFSVQFNYY